METIKQFIEQNQKTLQYPDSEGALRHLIFNSKENGITQANGLAPAFKRVGRRVLVDREKFYKLLGSNELEAA